MNLRLVLHSLGALITILGALMLLPMAVSLAGSEEIAGDFLVSCAVAIGCGLVFFVPTRGGEREMGVRESFFVVSMGWLAAGVFGALPYYLSGVLSNPVDALFENISGFTTTGATLFADVETLPRGLLLWRSMSQWLGGMGIIVLSVAVLPFFRIGGMQLYRAEIPGPVAERVSPRITDTARVLWRLYFGLSVLEILLLKAGGVSWFESVCHTFTTMATGGFSTRNESIMAFGSLYVELVIVFFMFVAGINFILHYRLLIQRRFAFFRSEEFRLYGFLLLAATAVMAGFLVLGETTAFFPALRQGLFQAVSIMTTTGYSTADFARWPAVVQFILLALMLIGGCAGSTGGGIKVGRILIMGKQMVAQFKGHLHPRAILPVRVDKKVVDSEIVTAIFTFTGLYFTILFGATVVIAALGFDLVTAISAVVASIGNVGPGLGLVGPLSTYAVIPDPGKIVLMAAMLMGRLEIYTLAVLLFPGFWRD